jgi:SAM-dependent methyltransferase
MASDPYIIRGGAEGRARLRVLTAAMGPYTNPFLDSAEIPAGAGVLDIGCGGGDVTRELARRVGPRGQALGADIDAVKIALAREEPGDNVQFEVADVLTGALAGPFDVVYARFLLSHLTDPAAALRRMLALLKPGGMLLVEDVDFAGHFCHPPRASFDNYVRWYREAAQRRGADACLGAKLPAFVRDAGAVKIEPRAINPAACEGPIKHMAPMTLAAIADSLVAEKIAERGAIDADVADLEAAALDTAVFMSIPRIVQVRAFRAD